MTNRQTQNQKTPRDHGGGIDAAIARWGGTRAGWLDLSTGINPTPYPVTAFPADAWTALPDKTAQEALLRAARQFWNVPDTAAILAAPGASALIARIPALAATGQVDIPTPTYNEHAAAFAAQSWRFAENAPDARVLVHPNNPTGHFWSTADLTAPLMVIDESFCDIAPERSMIAEAAKPGRIILKSFGKFWGLAGARLGFAIGDPALITQLADFMGPWAVSGPALHLGTAALSDPDWAAETRARLAQDATRLDEMICAQGATLAGGTDLFRLYEVADAALWQERLAQSHVWSRIFPYSKSFLRLGLPAADRWAQLEAAL
ncbi:threonine-phosphate decarboxylase [Shimia marina]|uniref:Aminotransferase n=1 Tax=Shimia marina TaxID=321267 RepID=A0A0P1ETV0_9RHOB|nr:threonine-phosphate decarboxylase [Shimia marina]CUH53935.1 Threonine-phosphate decarboxylase [Shimia marina]SFE18834.1 L-threonine O-3-phosphate decarboxylase [Shimia marina]